MSLPLRIARLMVPALVLLSASCHSSDTGDPDPGGGGDTDRFSMTLQGAGVSASQGGSGTIGLTIVRDADFSGPVALAATGLPAGVTASFQPASLSGAVVTSTLTLTASSSAALATSTITVKATNAGADTKSATFPLSISAVTAAGPFALTASVASYLALPPTAVVSPPTVTVTRNPGFTGPVTFSVTGAPAGLVFAVGVLAGNTAPMLILNGGAAPGSYPVVIHGNGGGGSQTATVQVVVAPPTTGSVSWKFCSRYPVYFMAVKDGGGAWIRIVPSDDGATFNFPVTQAAVSVAMITTDSGVPRTSVVQYTAAQLAAAAAVECTLYPPSTSRTASGTVAGVSAGQLSYLGMSFWLGSTSGSQSYTMLNLPPGPVDLVGFRGQVNAAPDLVFDRGIVRRGVNPPSGGTNAVLDFGSAESFAVSTAAWTFGNTGGENFSLVQDFRTASGTVLTTVAGIDHTTTLRTLFGVPAAQTQPGDLHMVLATIGASLPAHPTRQIVAYSHTLSDRSIDFGPALATPTVTVAAGGPPRLRAQGTLATVYNTGVELDVKSTGTLPRFADVTATRGFLGAGSTYDIEMPDLSAVLGWDSNWNFRAGDLTEWKVSGGGAVWDYTQARYVFSSTRSRWAGALTGAETPADGSTYYMGRAFGTITP